MEDLDREREIPGCADQMLRTLEAHGLTWDGAVEYQTRRASGYAAALAGLVRLGLTFECSCSRRELSGEGGYPGSCREGPLHPGPTATRFRVDDGLIEFHDRAQGLCPFSLRERGDVVVRRRDGTFAYQLAVVVDDAQQGVTDVVRGADLLDNTPWQLALQRALRLPTPRYAHLPVVMEPEKGKLSKSRRSLALDPHAAGPSYINHLRSCNSPLRPSSSFNRHRRSSPGPVLIGASSGFAASGRWWRRARTGATNGVGSWVRAADVLR
jgi:glutamyl-Q tRNA(Asp) synthetase